MASYSDRLPITQAPIRRSFHAHHKNNSTDSNVVFEGESSAGYIVRSEDKLCNVELLQLKALDADSTAVKLMSVDSSTVFKGLKEQLEQWPLFFRSKEESGVEMHQGFVTLWSNFLIVETLLASISIQPLVAVPDTLHGWKLKLYGYIWMMSVICDFWGIAVTALFLGYLLGCPNKLAWCWMCEIGWTRSIPSLLVLLDGGLSCVAIAYSSWVLYGYAMGVVCLVVVAFFFSTAFMLATFLGKVGGKVTSKSYQ